MDEPIAPTRPKVRGPYKKKPKPTPYQQAEALVRRASTVCIARVRLKVDQNRPLGPENPYLLNPDGTYQTRQCKKLAILGGVVCLSHGGTAKQVREKAGKRLNALVEPSLIRLGELIQQEEHPPTALGAIRTVLERAGDTAGAIGPLKKDVGEKDTRPVINIGIKVGGIEKPVVTVGMLPSGGNSANSDNNDDIDGEVIVSDEDEA